MVGVGLTSVYPVTRPFSPLRTNAKLVGGGDGSSVRSEGIDSSSSQYLLHFRYENVLEEVALTFVDMAANDLGTCLAVEATCVQFPCALLLAWEGRSGQSQKVFHPHFRSQDVLSAVKGQHVREAFKRVDASDR